MPHAIPEPFRIKMVEAIRLPSRPEREQLLAQAGYNVMRVKAEDVFIDLVTDNGLTAMSDRQWAAMVLGDESYGGPRSFFALVDTVRRIFGFEHVTWAHQGRATEHALFSQLIQPGDYVLGNCQFQTTRWNIEAAGGKSVDLLIDEGYDLTNDYPFKGNIDLERLTSFIERVGATQVRLILQTITNNNNGGQPVSLENLRQTKAIAQRYGIPLFLDAARFAENAYLIKEREPGFSSTSVREIVYQISSLADGFFLSAKKDALVNMGGLLAVRDPVLFERITSRLNVCEGFLTHAGLSGRDLEALAVGLEESLDERFLAYRLGQVRYLGEQLIAAGVPLFWPLGGHGVHLDAARFLPHLTFQDLPCEALTIQLYLEGGIRASPLFGPLSRGEAAVGGATPPPAALVRLAIPRRVYTQSHLDYVADTVIRVYERRQQIDGVRLTAVSPSLPLWTARYEMIGGDCRSSE